MSDHSGVQSQWLAATRYSQIQSLRDATGNSVNFASPYTTAALIHDDVMTQNHI